MSLPCPAWVASGMLIALGLGSPAAPSQEAGQPPTRKPATTEAVARQVYSVRGGTAKDLASALTAHFQAEPSFRAVPDAGGTILLLSGPKAALDDALAVLRVIDRPTRTIRLEVVLVAMAGDDPKALDGVELSGATRDVMAKVRALQQKGVIASVQEVQLTTLERQVARSRTNESRPYVTGVAVLGGGGFPGRGAGGGPAGGPMSRSISYKEVGTSVQVTPEIGADGLVSLELRVEDAHMRAAEGGAAVGTDEKGAALPATEFVNSTLETRLKVRPGQMVLAEGSKTGAKSGQVQKVVLVSASTDEASPKDSK